ncbi:MAG: CBS domain-containing protein [Deltaproteobacteria bacterium]|jgi:CBS domain-containing protein
MVRAKDVMSKRVMTLKPDSRVVDVIRLLAENEVTGAPVVSDDMHLLGMVTEKDILMMLLYDKNIKTKTVADLMTKEVIFFTEEDDLMEIFKVLVENNFRRVPILSNGKLTGIISRGDIIHFLSEKAKTQQ